MCGIVGLVTVYKNGPTTEELATFRDMLVFDSVRGFDSTGVFGVTYQGNVNIVKAAITGAEMVTTWDYKNWAGDMLMKGQFLVGHNRWATRGVVNDHNAHPFWKDDKIVLVQNGTFKGGHKHLADTDVDSEAIAHLLARESNVETALQQVDAAYALVWYNVEEKSLYLIRNDERPLYIAYTEEGSMLFASEPNFIMCAAYRNNVKLTRPPYMLKELTLVKFTLDNEAHNGVWDSDNIEGDYKFRSTYDKSWQNFRQQYGAWGMPDAFDDAVGHEDWRAAPGASTRVIDTVAVECAMNGYFIMNNKESDSELVICQNRPTAQPALIELLDYVPGNDNPNCTCWWVYGSKMLASDTNPSPMFYRILHGMSEEQVKKMVDGQRYYWATTSTARKVKVGKAGDAEMFVITNYVTGLEEAHETISTPTH